MIRAVANVTEKDLEFARKAAPYFQNNTGYYFDKFTDSYENLVANIAETAAYIRETLVEDDVEWLSTAGITIYREHGDTVDTFRYEIDVTEDYVEA